MLLGFSVPKLSRLSRSVRFGLLVFATVFTLSLFAGFTRFFAKNDTTAIHVAIVAPLTGDRQDAAKEMIQSVELYFNQINEAGGINGREVRLLKFDDQNRPEKAQTLPKEISKSPALVVLGHLTSETSIAAGSGYQAMELPVITGTASADILTPQNPYYFRTTFTDSRQAQLLALYAQKVLNFQQASIIYSDDLYGQSLKTGFTEIFATDGRVQKAWSIDVNGNDFSREVDRIVGELAETENPGIVFLAVNDLKAEELIVKIRRRGLDLQLLGNDTFARESYPGLFKKYREEGRSPGYFLNGMNMAIPIIFDSADREAQEFANAYQQTYGQQPTYVGASYSNAAKVAIQAILDAGIRNQPATYRRDRQLIRDQLAAINNPAIALNGLMGPIYFNQTNDSSPPIRFGQFVEQSIISTPTQLSAVANLEIVDLEEELAADNIVALSTEAEQENRFFWKQQVVYTGIDINKLGRVEEANSSFSADFYFWVRYKDGADALAIEFPTAIANAVNPNSKIFDSETPLKAEKIDGLNYRLYRVSGDFKGRYDFRDYPFDRQALNIYFQNTKIPSDRLIYVVDTFGLKPKTDPEEKTKPYQSLQLWNFKNIQYAQENFPNTSTRGNPKLFGTNITVDYPGLSATITLQRRFAIFLVKTLLPLALLVLVLYSTLYFSENLSKERLKVAISSLLSSAVLLTAINSQLSGAGYTVAIEYGFYTFFGLCLFCILVSLMLEKHYAAGDKKKALALDRFARVFYISIVIGTISTYALLFGDRLS